jgi:hypothetical protein
VTACRRVELGDAVFAADQLFSASQDMDKPRFQFSIRFILLWVIPYVALVTALLNWSPYDKDFLNWNARLKAIMIVTGCWANGLTIRHYRRRVREQAEKRSLSQVSAKND